MIFPEYPAVDESYRSAHEAHFCTTYNGTAYITMVSDSFTQPNQATFLQIRRRRFPAGTELLATERLPGYWGDLLSEIVADFPRFLLQLQL